MKASDSSDICPLCTGTHPSWMCVDHLERGELLDEIYKLRKTLLTIKPNDNKNEDQTSPLLGHRRRKSDYRFGRRI